MNKCNFHQQTDAKRVCTNCGKTFCDDCAKQTDYTGRCIECESKHLIAQTKLCTKKQVGCLSSFFACVIGALVFWFLHLNFNDFTLVGKVGAFALGAFAILFGVLSLENGLKLKRTKKALQKLNSYCNKK